MPVSNIDLLIVGSGPAGLAAAIRAKEAGVDNIAIAERAEYPGGLLHQCIHNGFGLHYFEEDLTGPEYAYRFIKKAREVKIELWLGTMVLNMSSDRKVTLASAKDGVRVLQPKAIILAMGCRERTRQQLMIPGTRCAGVLTAGTAQRYINIDGLVPGREVVILGSGDIGMIMARRLTLEGADVKAVVEILPYVGGLIRNEVQCIHDFDIPLLLQHTVTNIHGTKRVEAVTITKVDENAQPVAGTERVISCDTVLLSVGLIPENELSITAGIDLDPVTGGPIVDHTMETCVPGIFAGGNVVHVHDLVDNVTSEAETAGVNAAEYIMDRRKAAARKLPVRAGKNIRYVVPHTIAADRDVSLYMRVKEPEEKVTLCIGGIYKKALRAVRPSEMLKVDLSSLELRKLKGKDNELVVSCEQRG